MSARHCCFMPASNEFASVDCVAHKLKIESLQASVFKSRVEKPIADLVQPN